MGASYLSKDCNEVVIEELIEPAVGLNSMNASKRSSSLAFSQSAQDEVEKVEVPMSKCVRRRKTVGLLKRRKLLEVTGGACTELECAGSGYADGVGVCKRNCEDGMHSVLPTEIRWSILRLLTQSELLSLRLISQTWKTTIDSLIQVNVTIQGASNEFQGKCNLPIKACRLISLQNPSHRHLFKASVPVEVKIFKGICSLNFEELVLRWSCITKLELCWRSTMKNLLFGKKGLERFLAMKVILPGLQSLKLGVLVNDNLGERTKLRILSNVTNILTFDYPSITDISVTFVGYRELHAENRYLTTAILPFVNRHANTLCSIDFILKYARHVVYPPAYPRHILFCVPANIRNNYKAPQSSSEGHLVTTQLRKPDSTPEICLEWVNMLKNVRKLEVAIMTRFLSWSIKHLDFFEPTIREYSKFLRRIDIMNVTMYDSGAHNTVTQLDARIFRDCIHLAQLRMYRAPIIFHEEETEPPTELIHLPELPKSLEELVIDGLPVSSLEILATVSTFLNLKNFHYFQSQVPRRNMLWSNGINWDILQCMIKHPGLVNVKVHVTSIGQMPSHTQYEEPLKILAKKHGWKTTGIVPGYMNMFQITLTKSVEN